MWMWVQGGVQVGFIWNGLVCGGGGSCARADTNGSIESDLCHHLPCELKHVRQLCEPLALMALVLCARPQPLPFPRIPPSTAASSHCLPALCSVRSCGCLAFDATSPFLIACLLFAPCVAAAVHGWRVRRQCLWHLSLFFYSARGCSCTWVACLPTMPVEQSWTMECLWWATAQIARTTWATGP